ncbi:MAG TPA: DUF4173 domain-containing protein, partial [Methylocystis sp.]|nr:DUF4173 domain-containing protein [Methylocystis sp.]
GLAAALAGFADFLFCWRMPGLSLALFLGALGLVSLAVNPRRASRQTMLAALAFLAVNLLAIVEEVNALSFILSVLGTIVFVLVVAAPDATRWRGLPGRTFLSLFAGPFLLLMDTLRVSRQAARRGDRLTFASTSMTWVLPAALFSIFVYLFAQANPIVESWLAALDLRLLIELFKDGRPLFWLFIICLIWPLLRVRSARQQERGRWRPVKPVNDGDLFGATAFTRSLVMLNALFALQTALDLAYLWGGLALPHGMSYAAYAHRGAYPLVITASLAAVIVLLAMRPGGPAESARIVRPLVLAFTAQNILLVMSSMLRLKLYVEAYSLTNWRLTAFIWFVLVAFGLLSIVAQILLGKSSSWLLRTNVAALVVTLYLCCFLNFPWIIADYNVDHSLEMTGAGPHLDFCYLQSLGPHVIPALDRVGWPSGPYARGPRDVLYARNMESLEDWRGFGFAAWRLRQYLAEQPQSPKTVYVKNCHTSD